MNPVRFAIERPYTVAVGVLLALLFSVLAYRRIPVQLKPSVENPVITVSTVYRGASPEEVEQQVTRKVEDLLQAVDGLDEITSASLEGQSSVRLEYQWGVDKDRAVVDVINKLSELEDLPPDAEQPVVALTSQEGENAVMWICSTGHLPPDRVRQLIEDQVEARLQRVPGVASLIVVGGEEREIRVLADPERVAARGLTWDELATALQRGAVDLRGGTVETGTRQLVVRTEGRSPDPAALADLVVRRDERGTVRVGDVAQVVDGYRERTSILHTNWEPSVAIGVRSEPGANVVTLIGGVDQQLEAINARFHEQGLDLQLVPVYRDTTYLNHALDFVWSSLWQGALLSVAVLLFFLRSVRSMLVVAVSIPTSLITVFLVMDAFGRTLNVVSLAGLAFASGMVVDNAIVVLENTFRHLELRKSARAAAEDGGREVWGGVLASTLTTMVVFIPVLGVQEEAGQLFADLALAISAAVGLSLVVSLTVVPCLCALLWRGAEGRALRDERGPGPFARWYSRVVEGAILPGGRGLARRLALVAVVLAVAALSVVLLPPAGYLPQGNTNLVFFIGSPIPGTRPEATERNMAPIEDWFRTQPAVDRYFLVSASGFHGGGVILREDMASGPELDAFRDAFMPVCFSIPGFRWLLPLRTSLFMETGKQFTVEITGPDLAVLDQAAAALQAELSTWPTVQPNGVTSDYVPGRPELTVTVDQHLAAEAGMTVTQVGQVVEAALAGRFVGTFAGSSQDVDINLVVPPERTASAAELASLPLVTPRGARTTLGALASVRRTSGPESVNRVERQRAISLTVNIRPEAPLQQVLDDVRTRAIPPVLASLPRDVGLDLGGTADKFSATLSALTRSFWLALLITWLLLVALFQSWFQPFVIMVSVPLATTGGLLGIALASRVSPDATFDLLSMLGFVILAGIVVNNAILVIHQSNNLRSGGMERRAALAEAARTRLRPILMTVITTVFGMAPLAIGGAKGAELYQGLAAVITGGLIVSTLFTLLFVPALVALGWDVQDAWERRRGRAGVASAETAAG